MATIAQVTFTASNGTNIDGWLDNNDDTWDVKGETSFAVDIQSNRAHGNYGSAFGFATNQYALDSDDHSCQGQVGNGLTVWGGEADIGGVCCRMVSPNWRECYAWYWLGHNGNANDIQGVEFDSSLNWSNITGFQATTDGGSAYVNGLLLKLKVENDAGNLSGYVTNMDTAADTAVDNSHYGSDHIYIGLIFSYQTATWATVDNWEGGDIGASYLQIHQSECVGTHGKLG